MFFEAGGNLLRRQRGGQKLLLEHLWPKLKMIVSCDYRITTTGLYSDYILPAAQHYEKLGNSMPSVHHLNYVLCDHATPPLNESLPDREIGVRLVEAGARGVALRLRFQHELSFAEIGRRWNAKPADVRYEYTRALDDYRDALRQVVAFHCPGRQEAVQAEVRSLMGGLGGE